MSKKPNPALDSHAYKALCIELMKRAEIPDSSDLIPVPANLLQIARLAIDTVQYIVPFDSLKVDFVSAGDALTSIARSGPSVWRLSPRAEAVLTALAVPKPAKLPQTVVDALSDAADLAREEIDHVIDCNSLPDQPEAWAEDNEHSGYHARDRVISLVDLDYRLRRAIDADIGAYPEETVAVAEHRIAKAKADMAELELARRRGDIA